MHNYQRHRPLPFPLPRIFPPNLTSHPKLVFLKTIMLTPGHMSINEKSWRPIHFVRTTLFAKIVLSKFINQQVVIISTTTCYVQVSICSNRVYRICVPGPRFLSKTKYMPAHFVTNYQRVINLGSFFVVTVTASITNVRWLKPLHPLVVPDRKEQKEIESNNISKQYILFSKQLLSICIPPFLYSLHAVWASNYILQLVFLPSYVLVVIYLHQI